MKKGDIVECISIKEDVQRFGCNDGDVKMLWYGSIYRIRDIEEHTMHTKIWLDNVYGSFNSALFELVNTNAIEVIK